MAATYKYRDTKPQGSRRNQTSATTVVSQSILDGKSPPSWSLADNPIALPQLRKLFTMAVERKPTDSIKSTWRHLDRREWNVFHWFYEILGIQPTSLNKEVPVHPKTDAMPYVPEWHMHRWILFHALIPIAIQHAYCAYTGHNLRPLAAFVLYSVAFKFNAIRQLHDMRRMGHIVGFLDGDTHERDGVPDVGIFKVIEIGRAHV